jgi:hypothetical protein
MVVSISLGYTKPRIFFSPEILWLKPLVGAALGKRRGVPEVFVGCRRSTRFLRPNKITRDIKLQETEIIKIFLL